MSEIIIVDNEFITVKYLDDKKLIYHTVHKPIPGEMLNAATDAGTDALEKYGVCKWLSDDRKNGPLSPEAMEYGFKVWIPRTMAAGWKYWANVVPEELVSAAALAPVMEELHSIGLRMMVFTDVEEGFEWLDQFED